jgi:S-adenosylmethionine:tRNA ribosyltransferase-isomerase
VRLEELDFPFPEELIAQEPSEPRDSCRLLVMDREAGDIQHRIFRELPELLRAGDVLVLNDSRVLPARVFARKESGGLVELLFLHELEPRSAYSPNGAAGEPAGSGSAEVWEVLARPSARLREGLSLRLEGGPELRLVGRLGEGRWRLLLPEGVEGVALLESHGSLPLPPYIKTALRQDADYQTVFARDPGSAAAPTAGLHFTPGLLAHLAEVGVETASVTLHVGLDTFRPVTAPRVEDHVIHREYYSVQPDPLRRLNRARAEGRRLVAVGTTSVRVLETLYGGLRESDPAGAVGGAGAAESDLGETAARGHTSLFITPGYRFRAVGALITNFHLPRTSLLALVMAFAGADRTRAAYREAITRRYRFFSFGDAMLIQGGGSPTGGGS